MVGKMRGGPAKAAILGSGMTGLISGSSIANTVTTGTFTIPIMKKLVFQKKSWCYRGFLISQWSDHATCNGAGIRNGKFYWRNLL